jgi:Domain of unknown function (DUF3303)
MKRCTSSRSADTARTIAFNKESKKAMLAIMPLMDTLPAKHGVKVVGMWTDLGAHTFYAVYETSSMDAYWAFLNEPQLFGWLSFNTSENRVLAGPEEVQAILMRD